MLMRSSWSFGRSVRPNPSQVAVSLWCVSSIGCSRRDLEGDGELP